MKAEGERNMKKKIFPGQTRESVRCLGLMLCFVVVFLVLQVSRAQAQWPGVVPSRDGTPISYETYGAGEPTLVFVHGWSCDSRYWREQIPFFSRNNRVVLLDLAGHGHSGSHRSGYTMRAFGEDVQAVVDVIGGGRVILIGHSMGGSVIAEAARLMPDRVLGLIGIDTLENVEYPLTREELDQMLSAFKQDFKAGTRHFVENMILPGTEPLLREWIISDMSAAPPAVALSAIEEMMTQYITGEAAGIFEEIPIPVVTVNGSLWPVNVEANRKHMFSFDAIVFDNADHFLMLNQAEKFNKSLEDAIDMVVKKRLK